MPEDVVYLCTQALGQDRPAPEADVFMITLECVSCGTMRTFRANDSLRGVLQRQHDHVSITVTCEGCQREVRVSLFWDSRTEHFAFHAPRLGPATRHQDTNGLNRPLP